MNLLELPKVKVSLSISGKEFAPEDFTNYIKIMPTKIRTKEDWPQAIKDNKELPEYLKPRCVWSYALEEQNCIELNTAVEKITKIFCPEEAKLNVFRNKHNIELGLQIVIHAKTMSMPVVTLKNRDIVFWGSVGADISFDIYTYEEIISE